MKTLYNKNEKKRNESIDGIRTLLIMKNNGLDFLLVATLTTELLMLTTNSFKTTLDF